MPRVGTVNYHVHKAERQAFEIDAGGIVGKLVSPELATTKVPLHDTRLGEASVSFERDGIAFAGLPSSVTDFDWKGWQSIYDEELSDFLESNLGAKEVVIFDHTVREDDPNSDRKPARNVHSDYSADGAKKRLVDILGEKRARQWATGHYAFINIWRPVRNPINSAPLAFLKPASVAPDDWILIDLIYPDRRGQIFGLAANEAHQWVYQSKMTPDEIAYFNIYDNQGLPSVGHSAVDMVEDPTIHTIRTSIESRTLIRYDG
ncbi:CmcJ/NvfI family oxidoreductase [Gymnodinialimonas hymeniacidonis]|uniref:CmcJ/NvfI family oxidoreductase n=1 Tax=Gymnodinialimonas hymeniacidonis TaxID=3126508 RepID=UPI0034C624C5